MSKASNFTKISPPLYRVMAISAHDTEVEIFTDQEAARQASKDFCDMGGYCCVSTTWSDRSIDGHVIWTSIDRQIDR